MSAGALTVASNGAYAATGDPSMARENDQYILLERAVKAEQARKKEEERQRRIEMGLPPEEEKPNFVKRVWRKIAGGKDDDATGSTAKDVVR